MPKNPEKIVDERLINDNIERKIINEPGDATWGQLIIPGKNETTGKTREGLKVVLFASYLLGYLLLETLKKVEQHNPDRLNIVGLVTDDPASPYAKISLKRRIWRLYKEDKIIDLETAMIESALTFGIPSFTGAVKTEYFRKLLTEWDPDAILVCVFGQIIDKPIIDYPSYGIYNFHPTDLTAHHGAGPRPFQDLIERNAMTSKFTIHQLTEQIDAGHVLGQSPPVNVRLKDGTMTDNLLVLDDKMLEPLDLMGYILIKELSRKKEQGVHGPVNNLDFAKYFSEDYKKKLMRPIQSNIPNDKLPLPSEFLTKSREVNGEWW